MSQENENNTRATANAAETQGEQSKTNVGGPAGANQAPANAAETQTELPKRDGGGPASADESTGSQTSEKKKESNLENAKHSTGPKTKSLSRYNAIKYGLYSKDVVIRTGDGKEDPEQYELLLEGLRRALKPRDVLEECLVRQIAEAQWRLRRAARAEVGEIRRTTDSYYARQSLDLFDEVDVLSGAFWARDEVKSSARDRVLHLQRKVTLLEQVRIALENDGYVGEELQNALDSEYGQNHSLSNSCHKFSQLAMCRLADEKKGPRPDQAEGEGPEADTGEELGPRKEAILRLIALHVDGLKTSLAGLEQAEAREHQASLLASNLPSREFVDKNVHYETARENSMKKAIELLLKLQSKKR